MWKCKECNSTNLAYYEEEVVGYERDINVNIQDPTDDESVSSERDEVSTEDKSIDYNYTCRDCRNVATSLPKLANWEVD